MRCNIKVNARMQLFRKVWSLGSSIAEMVQLKKVFCRSILEQSCVLWDSGLTQENRNSLERTQKTFFRLILEENYINYENALSVCHLETLEKRRKTMTLRFAQTSLANGHFSSQQIPHYENQNQREIQNLPCKYRKV